MPDKTVHSDRSHGGPGSSHQDAAKPEKGHENDDGRHGAVPGAPTNPSRSRVSGGGGERDIKHTHDPITKA